MSSYRIYFMDRWTGHIRTFIDFEANVEGEAHARAHTYIGHDIIELWCGPRKLLQYPPADHIASIAAHERLNA